jgi:hypothetical protein
MLGAVLLVRQLQVLALVLLLAIVRILVTSIVLGAPSAHGQPS